MKGKEFDMDPLQVPLVSPMIAVAPGSCCLKSQYIQLEAPVREQFLQLMSLSMSHSGMWKMPIGYKNWSHPVEGAIEIAIILETLSLNIMMMLM